MYQPPNNQGPVAVDQPFSSEDYSKPAPSPEPYANTQGYPQQPAYPNPSEQQQVYPNPTVQQPVYPNTTEQQPVYTNPTVQEPVSYPAPTQTSPLDEKLEPNFNNDLGSATNIDETIHVCMRVGFARKVFGLVAFQLLITTILIGIAKIPAVGEKLRDSPIMYDVSFFVCPIVLIISIIFAYVIRECKTCKFLEMPVLITFTLSMSVMVMYVCAWYDTFIVLLAGILTVPVTVGITAYTFYAKDSFSFCFAFLWGFVVLIFVAVILMIIPAVFSKGCYDIFYVLYCFLGALVYSLYLLWDVSLIFGKLGAEFSVDDYILAAMNIYIDIIYIFLYILSLLGSGKK